MIHPEKGSEHIKPTGNENNTAPKAASESPIVCWTVAMRDAQLAKHKPAIKNNTPTAIRRVFLFTVVGGVMVFIANWPHLVLFEH